MIETGRDSESRSEAIETLKEQLGIEGQLVGLYEEYELIKDARVNSGLRARSI